jgi:hypothetical protein
MCTEQLSMNHIIILDWSNYMHEVWTLKLLQTVLVTEAPGMTIKVDESLFTKYRNNNCQYSYSSGC